ncbi:amino acid adenylation domain-containing protein [Xenorhabdus sp. Reich]|uniref:Amino acid adenylation domain-containing protein n=1 Tax=Xenorhabdus littoralis TaxID=2582835 RepID=A0ABU4SL91_9GAMM|nr:amino acid adenylation domain-containing protein [Xenorhabdus sp. Reich]MDX7999380.1 amino acid adenylation domain-containing protein [Xenorhabdus sp. Reich]
MQTKHTVTFEDELRSHPLAQGAISAHPLSTEQKRIWLLTRLSDANMMPITAHYQAIGHLDIAAVQINLSQLVAKAETLRSLFIEVAGQPVRLLMPTGQVQFEFFDANIPANAGKEPDVGTTSEPELIIKQLQQPFNVNEGPLLRIFISKLSEEKYDVFLAAHPISLDEDSLKLIAESICLPESHLPLLSAGDLTAAFQAEQVHINDESVRSAIYQWGQKLQAPATTEIPIEFPRPEIKLTQRKIHTIQHGKTWRTKSPEHFISCWLAVLMRWQGSHAAVCGVKVRDSALSSVIGPLQTFLPVRVDLAENSTLQDISQQVAEQLAAGNKVSFSNLLEICPPKRDLSRTPYFQTGLRYIETAQSRDLNSKTAMLECPPLFSSSDLDLYITCHEGEQEMTLVMDYDCNILTKELVDTLTEALIAMLSTPHDQSFETALLISDKTRENILAISRGERTPALNITLTDLVAETVKSAPDNIAIVDDTQRLSYAELWQRSESVAANIQSHITQAKQIIAICLPRTADFVTTVLGVLRTGHAFLPIDPRLPSERIRFLLENSHSSLVITSQGQITHDWPEIPVLCIETLDTSIRWETPDNLSDNLSDKDAAYIIYTSGSTGQPKGVLVEHQQVVNNLIWRQQTWPLYPQDNILHNHSFSFDPSIWALFWPLINSATIVLADTAAMEDSSILINLIKQHQISILGGVPSLLGALVDHPQAENCHSIRLVLSGGETLNVDLVKKLHTVWQTRVINLYGPTETTIDALAYAVPNDVHDPIPIGYPLSNVDAFIVDPALNLVPCGVPGEIMIAGKGLARGYLGKPTETALRFLPNPFSTGRLYATGDIGRRLSNGAISYLGRRDHQVKIRGHRIELNEVSYAIRQILGISEVVVFAIGAGTEQARLIAASDQKADSDAHDILRQLSQHLPAYLVPAQFLLMDKLPRTTTGKVDLLKLVELATPTKTETITLKGQAPASKLEESIMQDFAQILGLSEVTPDTDFFAQGGTSILLTRLAGKLATQHQVQIPLHEFFRVPTPSAVAETIEIYRREGLSALLARQHAQTLEGDIRLDDNIQPLGLPHANWYQPEWVFLTGATGYLGLYLIEQLLKRTSSKIICLCRAKNSEHAKERIVEGLKKYRIEIEAELHRVDFLVGDLALPHFGLPDDQWQSLATHVDVIYHNGALVNFVYPYSALKATNVGGTQTVFELACTARLKSVHYVSTVDTLLATHTPRPFLEDDGPLRSAVGVPAGYTGSKWVAEGVANLARQRGIPVSIFRPGLILGHTETGASQSIDYLLVALRGFLPMGIVPDYPRIFDIVPVDYVAAAIVYISQQPQSQGKFFHLFNPDPVSIRQFCDWIQDFGYKFKIVPFEEGRKRALAVPPGHHLYPLIPLIKDADPEPHRALDPVYRHEVNPELEGQQTFGLLESSDIPRPVTMKAYAHKILNYLIETDFLIAPKNLQHQKQEQK